MATETLTLTANSFVQLTNGTQNAYIQVVTIGGGLLWADSAAQPAVGAAAHLLKKEIVTGTGLTVWGRAQRGSVTIRITRYS